MRCLVELSEAFGSVIKSLIYSRESSPFFPSTLAARECVVASTSSRRLDARFAFCVLLLRREVCDGPT